MFTVAIFIVVGTTSIRAQQGRWTHQIGIEVGPQYAFNSTHTAPDGKKLIAQDIGVGFGTAINYYYQFDRALFLSVSGVLGYFANGYVRRINADGSLPSLNTYNFNSFNPLINLALTAGLRYNFAVAGFQPYIGLEAGTYSIGGINIVDAAPNLALTPKIGFRYPLSKGLDFDGSAKLMYLFSGNVPFSYASLNVGVSYALNLTAE